MDLMYDPTVNERSLAQRHVAMWTLAAVFAGLAAMVLSWPVVDWLENAYTPAEWTRRTVRFFELFGEDWDRIVWIYGRWYDVAMEDHGRPPLAWLVAASLSLAIFVRGLATNRHRFEDTHLGGSRLATRRDLKDDELFDQTGIVLGRWRNTFKLIRNWEWLSAILIAPPGTAKTVQLITNLLADWPDGLKGRDGSRKLPGPCIIANDPKGEMYKKTAGWRSQQGPVFRLSWGRPDQSARWNPLSPKSYPGGVRCLELRRSLLIRLKAVYKHPDDCLNELLRIIRDSDNPAGLLERAPEAVGALAGEPKAAGAALRELVPHIQELQTLMSEREKHVDRLCAILIPDTVEQHWRITGREFLAGAIGFYMSRCERLGEEPSFGKLMDWLNGASKNGAGFRDLESYGTGEEYQTTLDDGTSVTKAVTAQGAPDNVGSEEAPTGGDADQDLTQQLLDEAIEEAEVYGYPARVAQDLRATRMKPDKERGSVVSTGGGAISIFKNAAVRSVTSTSSFPIEAVRGMRDQAGFLRPVTFFIVVSLEDAEFLGRITGLFFETVAAYAISQDEDEFKTPWDERGELLGRPLLFMADEFWTMPPLQSLLQIPALGRGQWVSLILVGQSYGQIGSKYGSKGSETVSTLKGATSYKLIPTQNDFQTAKEISETIGNRTMKQRSIGRKGFSLAAIFDGMMGRNAPDNAPNYNDSFTSAPLFRPDQVMSLEKLDPRKRKWGLQIVQITGYMNRPILCRPSCWFKDPKLKARARTPFRQWDLQATPAPGNSNEPPASSVERQNVAVGETAAPASAEGVLARLLAQQDGERK
jgi:type IV secretory pathway TraG/TraD family ATPase VirD4